MTGLAVLLLLAASILVASNGYGFLAVPNNQQDATILVVEGWAANHVADAALLEYQHGHYNTVATSGMRLPADPQQTPASHDSVADRAASLLALRGIPPAKIVACPANNTGWNRTPTTARAVRDRLHELGLTPKSINILTVGPHGRQTRLAYQRMFGKNVHIGIIPQPHPGFSTNRWWLSATGLKWMGKGIAGWLKECIFGLRN